MKQAVAIANEIMDRLAFGECYSTLPDTPTVAAKWGARMIVEKQKLDVVYDRQDNRGEKEDRLALHAWLDATGMPWLNAQIPWRNDKQDERRLDDGRFHIKASTNASFGYLYVCAWMEEA